MLELLRTATAQAGLSWPPAVRAMPSPSFHAKVVRVAAVVIDLLLPLPAGSGPLDQQYYGKHQLQHCDTATGADFVEGALFSLYVHVRGRACSKLGGCFHWDNRKYTFGCRMAAWRPWCQEACTWLRCSSPQRRTTPGPAMRYLTLANAMQLANVVFGPEDDLAVVHSCVDAVVNDRVGGVGSGALAGYINISHFGGFTSTTEDPGLLTFYVASARAVPHTLQISVSGMSVQCCSGGYRYKQPDLVGFNSWPASVSYKRAAGNAAPDPHFWYDWRCFLVGGSAQRGESRSANANAQRGESPVVCANANANANGGGRAEMDMIKAAVLASSQIIYVGVTKHVWAQFVHGKRFHIGWMMHSAEVWERLIARGAEITFGIGGYSVTFKLLDALLGMKSHDAAILLLEEQHNAKPSTIISHDQDRIPVTTFDAVREFYRWLYCERLSTRKKPPAPQMTQVEMALKEEQKGVMVFVLGDKLRQTRPWRVKDAKRKRKRAQARE